MQRIQSVQLYHANAARVFAVSAIACLTSVLVHCRPACGDGMVRVIDGKTPIVGKVVGLTRSVCSIMDRQGRLHHTNVRSLTAAKKISNRYEPHSTSTFRQLLREEFSDDYSVIGTTHYLVCAPGRRANQYAELFESIYRDVEQFYRVRGFELKAPEVPLVAVVFQNQTEFARYCLKDGVPPSPGLMGYYSLLTNRVALFDDANLLTDIRTLRNPAVDNTRPATVLAAINGSVAGTVIHETTHQVGYNLGVHSRLGGTPVWVVEGLATVLEPSGMRKRTGRRLISDRINPERADWFKKRHRPTRDMGSLARLIASDQHFHQSTLNSYSEAWAFTFFLMENPSRRQDFVSYLHQIGKRNPSQEYTARQRLNDFQAAFGDISRVEVEFIRYLDRM